MAAINMIWFRTLRYWGSPSIAHQGSQSRLAQNMRKFSDDESKVDDVRIKMLSMILLMKVRPKEVYKELSTGCSTKLKFKTWQEQNTEHA